MKLINAGFDWRFWGEILSAMLIFAGILVVPFAALELMINGILPMDIILLAVIMMAIGWIGMLWGGEK